MYKTNEWVVLVNNGKPMVEHQAQITSIDSSMIEGLRYALRFEGLTYSVRWFNESDLASVDELRITQ